MKDFVLCIYRGILFIPLGICIEHDWENTQKKWMTALHCGSWEFKVLDGKEYFEHSFLRFLKTSHLLPFYFEKKMINTHVFSTVFVAGRGDIFGYTDVFVLSDALPAQPRLTP